MVKAKSKDDLVDSSIERPPRGRMEGAGRGFALSTGCRAREISGLERSRVDLQRRTAWLDVTKYGTPRGVPLNSVSRDCVDVLPLARAIAWALLPDGAAATVGP